MVGIATNPPGETNIINELRDILARRYRVNPRIDPRIGAGVLSVSTPLPAAGASLLRDSGRPAVNRMRAMPEPISRSTERPGGCYTCRYFGERRDPAVWCAKPGGEHVRSQADR